MTFLPIVARELRVAARRRGTYWLRCVSAVIILVIGAWYLLISSGSSQHELARGLFAILTGITVLFCLLSGVWFTSDCLSFEKREETLGLLFLTDLRGYDVVTGKLVANSVSGVYSIAAVLPILALPLLLGGVTAGEFGRMAVLILDTLLFSLAAGICVSAFSRSQRQAMFVTLLLLLVFTIVIPALGSWGWLMGKVPAASHTWLLTSPGYAYFQAMDQDYNLQPARFWWSTGLVFGWGCVFLLLASLHAPRSWQQRPAEARRLWWRDQWRWWSFGDGAERLDFRVRLLGRAPYFWLAARARLGPAYVWGALGLVACGWTWGLARSRGEWLNEVNYVITGLLLNLLLKLWVGLEAGRQIAEDRRQGTFELLLATPHAVPDVLRGQWLALRRQFLGPVLVVLATFLLFALTAESAGMSAEEPEVRRDWVLFWAAAMLLLIADPLALHWNGMWRAVCSKGSLRAAVVNLAQILLLPWVLLALGILLLSLFWPMPPEEPWSRIFLCGWVGLGLGVDFVFGLAARRKLLKEFRFQATRRYALKHGR